MKVFLALFLFGISYCYSSGKLPEETNSTAHKTEETPEVNTRINFATDIQPILEKKCNPCHFPGGKMYEAMPFDQAATILKHQEGMQKRIKSGEEGELLRAYFEQEKNQ